MDLAGVIVPSKIKIKMGSFELEYESDEAISKQDVLEMVEKLSALLPKNALKLPKAEENGDQGDNSAGGQLKDMSTSTIAQRLKIDSGSGLAKAAMAKLIIFGKQRTVKSKELLTEMQTAKTYYKDTYSNNLTTYLKTLVSEGTFLESGTDTYALSEAGIASIKSGLNGQS